MADNSEIRYENFQEWQNLKTYEGTELRSYGPLATIMPLHLPFETKCEIRFIEAVPQT